MKKRIRPRALLLRQRSTRFVQRVVEHRPPPVGVEQSDSNRVPDERGYTGCLFGSDNFADGMHLVVSQLKS